MTEEIIDQPVQEQVPEQVPEQVQPDPPSAKRKLYDNLNGAGFYTKSFEDFDKQFSTPEKREKLYSTLNGAKYYTKTREEFEKQFFAPPPQEEPAVKEVPVVDTLRDLQKQADTVPQDMNTVVNMSGDSLTMIHGTTGADKQKEAQKNLVDKLDVTAKEWGVDKDYLKDAIKNFPHYSDEGVKRMAKLAKDNITEYARFVAGSDIQNTIARMHPPKEVVDVSYKLSPIGAANKINELSQVENVAQLMQNVPVQQDIINTYTVGDGINRRKANEDLRYMQSPLINTLDETVTEEYNKSGLSGTINKMQFTGLLTEKIFDPQQYEEDMKMLQYFGSEQGKKDTEKGNYDFMRGREQVLYKLYSIGKDNNERYFKSRGTELNNQITQLTKEYQSRIDAAHTPEEQQALVDEFNHHPLVGEMERIKGEKENLENYSRTEAQNFPMQATEAADRMVQEALDEGGEGFLSSTKRFARRFPAMIGKTADDTMGWMTTAFVNLLAARDVQMGIKTETIGRSKSTENLFFQPQSFTGIQRPFDFHKPVIKGVQEIFNSDDVPDNRKEAEAMKFLRDNQDKITVNPRAGEHNWTFKAGLNAGLDMVAMIAGTAAQTMLMGNVAGGAGKIKNMITAFTPMFMGMQQDMYSKAIANGENDPYLKTTVEAAIVAAAGLINPPAKVLRGMLSKDKVVGKIIAGMDDQTIEGIISKNKKWVSQIGEFAKGSAKQLGLASVQYGLVAPTLQTAFKRNYLGEDADWGKSMKEGALHTLISMAIPALFHGVQSVRAANVSPMQRLSIYEAALNSKNRIEIINQMEKDGKLSETQAFQMRTVVERAAKALKELPTDKKMTEQKRADIVYNMVRKEALKGRLKDAKTDLHKSNIESKIEEIDAEIADIKKSKDEPKPESAEQQPTAELTPEEQKIIQAIQETMKDSKSVVAQKMYEASFDPAKQKEIIQQLHDQSIDADAFIDTFGIDVLDAVYMMQEKTGEGSQYKTNDELHVDLNEKIQSLDDVKEKPRHTVSQAGVRNVKIKEGTPADLSIEPVSQYADQPVAEAKMFRDQAFTTKNGHTVKYENGNLVISDKNGKLLTDRKAIKKATDEYADAFDYTQGEGAPEPAEGMNQREIAHHVVETSNNPAEIAEIYIGEEPQSRLSAKEQIIATQGIGKIKRGSYINEGDRNNIGVSKAKTYFHKDGQTIDQVAKEISDATGVEVTAQDVVDFIDKFPNGPAEALKMQESDVAHAAKAKFKDLTGLDLTPEIAEKAIKAEFRNLEIAEQQLAQHEYETAEQLQRAYEEAFLVDASKDGNNQSNEPSEKAKGAAPDGEQIGITHAQMDEVSRELGLPEYEKSPEKEAEWIESAHKRIAEGKMPALIDKLRNGDIPDAIETKMMAIHAADLKAKINKDPKNDALLTEFNRFKNLSNVAGREQGKALRARQGLTPVTEVDVADYMQRNMEETQVDRLTEKQKDANIREHEEITAAKKAYEEKIAKLEAENKRLAAEKHTKQYNKNPKKTKEDFVAERKAIREAISAKLRESRAKANDVVTAVVDFVKIAPDVAKLVKSFAEEGIVKLDEIIKRVHTELKDDIEGITEKDVRDLIAGEYSDRKLPTKNQLQENLFNLQMEAKLANKLEALIETGKRPKSEKRQRQYNKEVTELKRQIKSLEKNISESHKETKRLIENAERAEREHKEAQERQAKQKEVDRLRAEALEARKMADEAKYKSPEEIALQAIKTRTKKQIEAIEEKLKTGQFEPEVKNKVPLDKEARQLKDKLMDLKMEREQRILREKYENQTGWEKTGHLALEVANLPRTIMSSFDLSAPFRQGLVAFVAHPIVGAKAFGKMLHAAVSQKEFDRFFYDLRNSEDFHIMEEAKLGITDPHDPKMTAKEEAFMNNLAQRIPVAGRFIKGSERAYTLFLNKMRVDVFRQGMESFNNSKFKDNTDPKVFQDALADHINSITGRGRLPKFVEGAAPTLNTILFSPRLIASRIRLLTNFFNYKWYKETPAAVRRMYFRDMAVFTMFGATLMGLSKLALGDDLEMDPRSTDFLKYKSGDERIDVLGGFQQYLRVIAQMVSGEKMRDGKVTELNGEGAFGEDRTDVLGRFIRGKFSPNMALITDIVSGRDLMGNELILNEWNPQGKKEKGIADILGTYALPMTGTDVKRVFTDKDMRSVGLLSLAVFGASVQSLDRSGSTSSKPKKPHKPKRIKRP